MPYSVGMDTLIEPSPAQWHLLVLPRALRNRFLSGLGVIAQKKTLLVLDGGNQFNAYLVSRSVRGRADILNRIRVSRAFTCYQMVALLHSLPQTTNPIVCLDFLATFLHESLPVHERQRLLESCLPHFARLSQSAELIVAISAPKVTLPETNPFLDILQNAAAHTWRPEMPAPAPEPPRLF